MKKDGRKVRKAAKNEIFILKMWVRRAPRERVLLWFLKSVYIPEEEIYNDICWTAFMERQWESEVLSRDAFVPMQQFRLDRVARKEEMRQMFSNYFCEEAQWRHRTTDCQAEFLHSRSPCSVMRDLCSIICNLLKALLFGINNSTLMSICSKALWNKQQGWQKT